MKTRYLASVLLLSIALPADRAAAIMFKSEVVKANWDNWCYYDRGTHYLYYLITEHSGGEGFGVASSRDGVHWQDHGWAIRASHQMVEYLGTGAVWKSPDFDKTGRFLCNYSEWRKEPETGRKTQNILFAWSKDLLRWTKLGDEFMFPVDPRHYDQYGRWDCIYPMPRAEGGYWGTWTATAKPGQPGGIVGIGVSQDGIRWTAWPAPVVLPGVDESGAFWRFGKRIHAMFGAGGNMWSYVAEQVPGPYLRAKKNARLLPAGHTYFSRFFPLPGGTVLVNHQSRSDWGWHVAALKQAVVDAEGTLRLKYWKGNEALKGEPRPPSPQGRSNAVVMVSEPLDVECGFIAEGTVRLPARGKPPAGFYLLPNNRAGHAVRLWADSHAEFGTMDPFGRGWECRLATDRDWQFDSRATFHLLVRRGMLELYLDDYLVNCYCLDGCGGCENISLGLLGSVPGNAISDLKIWRMSYRGKAKATASSIHTGDYAAGRAVDGNRGNRRPAAFPAASPSGCKSTSEHPKLSSSCSKGETPWARCTVP
jgi:hypothetical protein